jgi:hypothetical protein
MSTTESDTRQEIKTLALTLLDVPQVKLGLEDVAETEDFLADLPTEGPFMIIMPAEMKSFDAQLGMSVFNVPSRLYFALPADSDQTFIAIEDLAFQIRNVLFSATSYDGILMDGTMTRKMDADQKPLVGYYEFNMDFKAPVCAD